MEVQGLTLDRSASRSEKILWIGPLVLREIKDINGSSRTRSHLSKK